MTRGELEEYIVNNYSAEPDYPWIRYPSNEVFRHVGKKKWFALIMDVQRDKLGLPGKELIDIADFKCDPALISLLLEEKGFFPAYHMNKKNWITAALDGSADDEKIKMLLDMSYNATAPKIRGKR